MVRSWILVLFDYNVHQINILCALGIAIVILVLYLTSVYHWWKPRFNRMARYLDYAAVLTCLAYGSYYAVERGLKYISIWFCGLSLIGILFMINEVITGFVIKMLRRELSILFSDVILFPSAEECNWR